MKNILVGFATFFIIALMVLTFIRGGAYQGGEHAKVIEDMGDKVAAQSSSFTDTQDKSDREKEQEQLRALRDKAGNVGAFKVSNAYKNKCASCHGVNGSGIQNGKKLMGPKLFGQSSDEIYTKLEDFKAGRKENMIMKGLLLNLSKEDLKTFADEIGAFPTKAQALKDEQ